MERESFVRCPDEGACNDDSEALQAPRSRAPSKTGESYAAAHRHVARTRDRITSARTDLAGATELASDARITEVTGRSWEAWLSLLDRWGKRQRKRGETVDHLIAEHGVAHWWAQTIAAGYERTRGLRLKHQQPDGFTIYASRTVNVPIGVLYEPSSTGERASNG